MPKTEQKSDCCNASISQEWNALPVHKRTTKHPICNECGKSCTSHDKILPTNSCTHQNCNDDAICFKCNKQQ